METMIMNRLVLACVFLVSICNPLLAESGDTNIRVVYKTQWIKDRPTHAEGVATVSWQIVLHANGKIDDTWTESNGRSGRTSKTLGGRSGVAFRVVDQNTITRTWDAGTHIEKLTIRVAEKSCTARYEYLLKPNQKEYSHPTGFYRQLKMVESACAISD